MKKFRKNIDLPDSEDFKKALKKQAIDEGYNSPKEMIEKKTIEGVQKYQKNQEHANTSRI